MSIAKHHNEWLSLLDISGPFLSLPVLLRVYPQGLEAHDAEASREARLAHEEWLDNQQGLRPENAMHTLWVRYVFERLLGFSNETIAESVAISPTLRVTFAEHGETLQPDLVLHQPNDPTKPHVLVEVYPVGQNLDKTVAEKRWKTSPAMRMMELLRATGVRLGLVTNGEEWMLVDAPRGETSAFVSWYASLWFEEPLTLRSFRSLLSAQRFFSVQDKETLEGMLADSVNEQQEVTEQLGYQVRRAVEVLIRSIDRADRDRERKLLQGIKESELYEAALTVMMRLVFLFSAEERGLLLLGDPLYDQHYAISTLRAQLREIADQHGEEVLERRFDAWCRLLATFRAVYGGIQHDRLRLPAYGGSLFDPERFPFLEGRLRDVPVNDDDHPLPINNRTVLHLLEALQILRMPVPGGGKEPRRLSFRSLDVEQIGHVYEGLLDHTAVRATEIVLGLAGSRDKEPEVGLSSLIAEQAKGQERFAKYLAENTGRTENAIRKNLSAELDSFQIQRLKSACGNDPQIFQKVQPFAGMIREDGFEMPMVILSGNVYVTAGVTRRATGTHYTPRSLTEPVVQHTLEPLVYIGVAEGLPREEWKLRSPAEILALKVCDMAMGSAGFLVQADRYLAERLMEAWAIASEGGIQITPDGIPSKGLPGETLLPKDEDERMILARRLVADRCLYGVDKNPLAVEIAKLSLWLTTMAKGRPFTFLNHALKCGDALVGASADDFLRWAHGYQNSAMTLFDEQLHLQLEIASQKRRELEAFEVKDVRDSALKADLLKEADAAMNHIKRGCDLLTGARMLGLSDREIEELQMGLLFPYMAGDLDGEIDAGKHPEAARALNIAKKDLVFHWESEFPEVFEHGGFSAFVGNPPFLGGKRIVRTLGSDYQQTLRVIYPSINKNADICVYFFHQAFRFLFQNGYWGFISTKTIAEGDVREAGLDLLTKAGARIIVADTDKNWPGSASVLITVVCMTKTKWNSFCILNGKTVKNISSYLVDESSTGETHTLKIRNGQVFTGSAVYGDGFMISELEAEQLLSNFKNNSDVVRKYITGKTFTSEPYPNYSGWIIYFGEKSEDESRLYNATWQIIEERVKPFRMNARPGPLRTYYWQYERPRIELYKSISTLARVLVNARVAKYIAFDFLPSDYVFLNTLQVFPFEDYSHFCVLQSDFHASWASHRSSSVGITAQYTPSDCFLTFPFPLSIEVGKDNALELIGEKYYLQRTDLLSKNRLSLTDIYNRFHNPKESAEDIVRLREFHVEMDNAVAGAYGWGDLELGHSFHETAQGIRYTISESARREVLSRLLGLNHERHEEEQKQSALEGEKPKSKGGKKGKKSKTSDEQMGLL
ncbi:MAG: DNA methyltransferase [Chloroflexota bacterium]